MLNSEFKEFCESLHGLTRKDIIESVKSELRRLDMLQAGAPARAPKNPTYLVLTKNDYLKAIQRATKILTLIEYGTMPFNPSSDNSDNELLAEIERRMKPDTKQ